MSRALTAALAVSLIAHAGAGIALSWWHRALGRDAANAPIHDDAPELLLRTGPSPFLPPGGEPDLPPAPDSSQPDGALDSVPPVAPLRRPALAPSPLNPGSPPVVTPIALAAPSLQPIPASPVPVQLVAAGLPTFTALPAVDPATVPEGVSRGPSADRGGQGSRGPGDAAAYRHRPTPRYPPEALANRWEGLVLLSVDLGPDGRPTDLLVKESSGHPTLDAAAVAAVRAWEFEPARIGGQGVLTTVEVPVRFFLSAHRAR